MDAPGDERGGPQARVQSQLSVRHGRADAHEAVVAQLSVGDSWFWVADESPAHANFSPPSLGGGTVRMLLIAADPAALVAQAVAAGAREVTPVADQHGWRLGRIED